MNRWLLLGKPVNSRAQQPDTQADIELRACVEAVPPISFNMVAGAGSGKTTSLIKGLTSVLAIHGERLRLRRQKIACITYTEVAAGEIWADVANNPLVQVSTIHSFLWSVVRHFQTDIAGWVASKIEQRIAELQEAAANYGPRVQQKTKDKNQRDIERYQQQRAVIDQVKLFSYGTGSNYLKGILGHSDIIQMVPELVLERPLMRALIAQQFPFIFVDESQDTFPIVVDALKAIQQQEAARFCLGFFGDPMQRIYPTGIGAIALMDGWREISKPENFRAPTSVLAVANAIRRDGDALVQIGGRKTRVGEDDVAVDGTARFFILPADEQRTERVAAVRRWVANANADDQWLPDAPADAVKMLVIVHRMAATRLGFRNLYSALNDKAPESFKMGFLDATLWPVRPFVSFIAPLAQAVMDGREFDAVQLIRQHSPLLAKSHLVGVNMTERLAELRQLAQQISALMAPNSHASVRDVLAVVRTSGLLELDPRFAFYFQVGGEATPALEDANDDGEDAHAEADAVNAFLACPAHEFFPYLNYVAEASPFSTQQGVKGAEFDRVLTVLDDEEGRHFQFSYEKYFGIKPLSDSDKKALDEGKEISADRTRRLFYVCCTRARQDLVVVFFAPNPDEALAQIRQMDIFSPAHLHTIADLI